MHLLVEFFGSDPINLGKLEDYIFSSIPFFENMLIDEKQKCGIGKSLFFGFRVNSQCSLKDSKSLTTTNYN